MISINLKPQSKTFDHTNVGGFDLSLLNIKFIFVAIAILYIPEPFVVDYYDAEIQKVSQELRSMEAEQRKLRTKLKSLQDIEKQVSELQALEEALQEKIGVVTEVVNKRENPFKVLKYIAENIPKEVWLTRLKLEGKKLEIFGRTMTLKGTSDLIQNLQSGIYFSRINYSDYDEVAENNNNNNNQNNEENSEPEEPKLYKSFKLDTTISSF